MRGDWFSPIFMTRYNQRLIVCFLCTIFGPQTKSWVLFPQPRIDFSTKAVILPLRAALSRHLLGALFQPDHAIFLLDPAGADHFLHGFSSFLEIR